jgi:hypothetical protein
MMRSADQSGSSPRVVKILYQTQLLSLSPHLTSKQYPDRTPLIILSVPGMNLEKSEYAP